MAPKGNKNAIGNQGGRPTSYREEFSEQTYKLCLLGATDKELADFFEVCEKTINTWKKDYPEFLQSLKRGKTLADANVVSRLYERATGYSHEDVHISNFQGDITQPPIMKRYPPDTTAAIFWLKNRNPQEWREKKIIDVGMGSMADVLRQLDREERPMLPMDSHKNLTI